MIEKFFAWLLDKLLPPPPAIAKPVATIPAKQPLPAVLPKPEPLPAPVNPPPPAYLWDTPANVRHSLRVMCDEAGLYGVFETINGRTWTAKDIITACVYQESRYNPKAIGKVNSNGTKDWGLCQYNDGQLHGKYLWIGPGAAFEDTHEVLSDPEKNVRIMIQQYKAGHIGYWSSYHTGAYIQWLGKV